MPIMIQRYASVFPYTRSTDSYDNYKNYKNSPTSELPTDWLIFLAKCANEGVQFEDMNTYYDAADKAYDDWGPATSYLGAPGTEAKNPAKYKEYCEELANRFINSHDENAVPRVAAQQADDVSTNKIKQDTDQLINKKYSSVNALLTEYHGHLITELAKELAKIRSKDTRDEIELHTRNNETLTSPHILIEARKRDLFNAINEEKLDLNDIAAKKSALFNELKKSNSSISPPDIDKIVNKLMALHVLRQPFNQRNETVDKRLNCLRACIQKIDEMPREGSTIRTVLGEQRKASNASFFTRKSSHGEDLLKSIEKVTGYAPQPQVTAAKKDHLRLQN